MTVFNKTELRQLDAPDFAMPQTVAKNAEKLLKKARQNGDGENTIRAAVQMTLALLKRDRDSLNVAVGRIDDIINEEPNPSTKAVLHLMAAKVYNDVYNSDRWKYDSRELPDEPLPQRIEEWGKQHFRKAIISHIDEALSGKESLAKEDIRNYLKAITIRDNMVPFYPSLYDFVAFQSIQLLESFSEKNILFAWRWLCEWRAYANLQFNATDPIAARILRVYQSLDEVNHNNTPAFIIDELERIKFIEKRIYSGDTDDTDGTDDSDLIEKMAQADPDINPDAYADREIKLYYDLFEKYKDSDYATEILLRIHHIFKLPYLQSFAKAHSHYFRIDALNAIIDENFNKSMSISCRDIVLPGDTLAVKVTVKNINEYAFSLYRVTKYDDINEAVLADSRYYYNKNDKNDKLPRLVKTWNFTCEGTAPFSKEVAHIITINEPGIYVLIPHVERNHKFDSDRFSGEIIRCTSLLLGYDTDNNEMSGYVVDPKSGKPLEKVTLTKRHFNYRNDTPEVLGTKLSDKDGRFSTLHLTEKSTQINASLGNDIYSEGIGVSSRRQADNKEKVSIDINTDLSIYHPGDSVHYSVVAYSSVDGDATPLRNEKITVRLFDVNHSEKGKTVVMTDNWGRAEGAFLLPTDGLTGNFSIRGYFSGLKNYSGLKSFVMSDYKLPTYYVETEKVLMDTPTKGSVTVKGRAMTYSGFPVAEADVLADLEVAPLWSWYSRRYVSFRTDSLKTDAEGRFSIEYPAEMLKDSPIPNGYFRAKLTVTSTAGETREGGATFTRGKALRLNVSASSTINASNPLSVNALLKENGEKEIDATVAYEIRRRDNNAVLLSGTFPTGTVDLDLSAFDSGHYTITFKVVEYPDVAADYHSLLLYRHSDKAAPDNRLLWVEKSSLNADAKRKATIWFATSLPMSFVYATVSDDKGVVKREVMKVGAGFHEYPITLTAAKSRYSVQFTTTGNYDSEQESVDVYTADYFDDNITISTETFRDKITPGAEETWTFTVKDKTGKGKASAVILDMYSKSLEQLCRHNISVSSPYRPRFYLTCDINKSSSADASARISAPDKKYKIPEFRIPEIFTYGEYSFYYLLPELYYSSVKYRNSALGGAGAVVREERVMAMAAEPMLAKSAEVSDTASEDESEIKAMGKGSDKGEAANDDNFEYRDAETPLAFFRPMLNTDPNGNLSFSFTAPNQNTTWLLHAKAFTPEMKTAGLTKEILSNKPIMVKPNPPRFLRQGDKAEIRATVVNNSEEEHKVTTIIEVFDPMTGKVLNMNKKESSLAVGGSDIASIVIDAPFDATAIGYRVKSLTDNYADGEQSLIPVLSSVTPVIESTTFYLAPDSTYYTTDLPKMPADSRVTMQFCENPAWYCVTALPGIRKDVDRTASSSAAAIFSAAIADGILRTNPNIATVIKQWKESDRSDSTLVSMLEKNQDLKIVLLNSTPWVMDARSQTERMQRLCLLLDRNEIDAVYNAGISRLAKLQRHGGGWAWIDECPNASYWTTINALALFGRLKELNFLPNDKRLNDMIGNAVKYIDAEVARMYRDYPKSIFVDYIIARDHYRDIVKLPSINKKAYNRTISHIAANWRKDDIPNKAIDAIILNNNNHSTTAREILASLREYSASNVKYGMWWPSVDELNGWSIAKISAASIALDAFHAIEPNCKEIDQIRQWLILQREAKDWGTSATTADIVASILTSGTNWIAPSNSTYSITVGNGEINPDRTEVGTGYFRRNINDLIIPGVENRLSIQRHANHPSWGSVICQFRAEMSEVKAVGSDAADVEKRFFVEKATPEGRKWVETTDIKVGDRVKINLRIITSRDMDYVAIIDDRAACFEPVEQLPKPIYKEGIYFYRENRDAATNIYVTHLPKGTYLLEYEMFVNNSGTFSSGIATLQCQQAPQLTAHSAGAILKAADK